LTVAVGNAKLKTLAAEWLDKAESDFLVLERLRTISKDHLCYYSRQCAERYLKAFLQEHDTYFPKTYDLLELLALCLPLDSDLEQQRDVLTRLNQYSEDILYPGRRATAAEARLAQQDATQVRTFVRAALGI
jgi:HEPN domain-containing protein